MLNTSISSLEDVYAWIEKSRKNTSVSIETVDLEKLRKWSFNHESIRHESGGFFSIVGVSVKTNWGEGDEWNQPIISQPEIGVLGIITKYFDGVLHFLMQAKIEPGNINYVQISPTVQATKSNYTQVHQGRRPHYLEFFFDNKSTVILDQLQSEQGDRFLSKRNRNLIILIDKEVEVLPDYKWMTLAQIKHLLKEDNIINMDTRTVISGINFLNDFAPFKLSDELLLNSTFFGSAISDLSVNSFDSILHWLAELKTKYSLEVSRLPLRYLSDWELASGVIEHSAKNYFKVIGARISISSREVSSWDQPLIQSVNEGIMAFIVKKINGVLHFLVQAKVECGNFDIVELAPTLQCVTGEKDHQRYKTENFYEYISNVPKEQILYSSYQSEEGGRFNKEQNKNLIVLADNKFSYEGIPQNFKWLTLRQIHILLKFPRMLNIQARSLLSLIDYKL